MSDNDPPKIQIDSDWKAEAQREKQRLVEQAAASAKQQAASAAPDQTAGAAPTAAQQAAAAAAGTGARELPPANFDTLVSMLASQALLYLGAMPDPRSGRPILHLGLARHHIVLLGVLEEKSKGNLEKEQSDSLAATLFELRNQYVSMVTASRSTAQN